MRFDAIVLDFGNTLVPWREEHDRALLAAIGATVAEVAGPVDDFDARASALHDRLVRERRDTTMRQPTVAELCTALFGGEPPEGLVPAVERTIHATVVDLCRVPEGVAATLDRLRARHPLAVLSDFILASPVEEVLRRAGLLERLEHVEVSATRGWMKPHPEPFEIVREKLGTPMERTLMVGDDFWCDIVGGHRAGFVTALTREHRAGPDADPRAPDVRADLVLSRLDELGRA